MARMTDEETIRLIFETLGIEGLKAAGVSLDDLKKKVNDATGTEGGDEGILGFTKNAYKMERAVDMLATGRVTRLAPLLEGITTALGMTSGVGFAIGGLIMAFEAVGPHIKKFFDSWDEGKLKASAEQMKTLVGEMNALAKIQTPFAKEGEADVMKYLTAVGPAQIVEGIKQSLRIQPEFGLTPEERWIKQSIADTRARGQIVNPWLLRQESQMQEKQQKAIEEEAAKLIKALPTSAMERQRLAGMAQLRPGFFPPEFAEGILQVGPEAVEEESRIEREEAIAEAGRRGILEAKRWEAKKAREAHTEALKKARKIEHQQNEQQRLNDQIMANIEREQALGMQQAEENRRAIASEYQDWLKQRMRPEDLHKFQQQRLGVARNVATQEAGMLGLNEAQKEEAARMAAEFPGDLIQNVDVAFGIIVEKLMRNQRQYKIAEDRIQRYAQKLQSLEPDVSGNADFDPSVYKR